MNRFGPGMYEKDSVLNVYLLILGARVGAVG